MTTVEERCSRVASALFDNTLSKGFGVFVRCDFFESPVKPHESLTRVYVLSVVVTEVPQREILFDYFFETQHDAGETKSRDTLNIMAASNTSATIEAVSKVLLTWRVCEPNYPHRMYGNERFDGSICLRKGAGAVMFDKLAPGHPVMIECLSRAVGYLEGLTFQQHTSD